MAKRKQLNEPDIPGLTVFEEMEIDLVELSKAISRLRYHNLIVNEFLTELQVEIIRKYAP